MKISYVGDGVDDTSDRESSGTANGKAYKNVKHKFLKKSRLTRFSLAAKNIDTTVLILVLKLKLNIKNQNQFSAIRLLNTLSMALNPT